MVEDDGADADQRTAGIAAVIRGHASAPALGSRSVMPLTTVHALNLLASMAARSLCCSSFDLAGQGDDAFLHVHLDAAALDDGVAGELGYWTWSVMVPSVTALLSLGQT